MSPTRREFILGAAGAAIAAACSKERPMKTAPLPDRTPALFIGHGAPLLAIDPQRGAPLVELGRSFPKPRGVLVVSAHWEDSPVTIGAVQTRPLVYDFSGFPRALYEVEYPAPGAPELAEQVRKRLSDQAVRDEPARGLDHGVWTPLVHLFPDADVPVLQVSMPSSLGARGVYELGRRLAPLREEGYLVIGSGNITHNLRAMRPDGSLPESWAAEFDQWVAEAMVTADVDALLAYRDKAPAFRRNHPSEDHWLPLFFTLGSADPAAEAVSFPVEGFEYGNLSRRAVRIG